jgi:hypothetical protein
MRRSAQIRQPVTVESDRVAEENAEILVRILRSSKLGQAANLGADALEAGSPYWLLGHIPRQDWQQVRKVMDHLLDYAQDDRRKRMVAGRTDVGIDPVTVLIDGPEHIIQCHFSTNISACLSCMAVSKTVPARTTSHPDRHRSSTKRKRQERRRGGG